CNLPPRRKRATNECRPPADDDNDGFAHLWEEVLTSQPPRNTGGDLDSDDTLPRSTGSSADVTTT
ncbi:hypothetical protein P7K49_036963, partial [Saguinus oedipus]